MNRDGEDIMSISNRAPYKYSKAVLVHGSFLFYICLSSSNESIYSHGPSVCS